MAKALTYNKKVVAEENGNESGNDAWVRNSKLLKLNNIVFVAVAVTA